MAQRSHLCLSKLFFLSRRRPIIIPKQSSHPFPPPCTNPFLLLQNPTTTKPYSHSRSYTRHLHFHLSLSNTTRHFSSSDSYRSSDVDKINMKFAEAREEIESAMESKDTVYFDEEAECARAAVKEVLDMFDGLLQRLPEEERAALQRSMGLKMEQLKAELKQLED